MRKHLNIRKTGTFLLIMLLAGTSFGIGKVIALSGMEGAHPRENNRASSVRLLQELECDYPDILRVYPNMTPDKRLAFITRIAEIEAAELGLPNAPSVANAELTGKKAAGYSHRKNQITISNHVLESYSPYMIMEVVAHESFHAYQHCLVDLYDELSEQQRVLLCFEDIEEYKRNIENYISCSEDEFAYENQLLEQRADEYAHDEMYIYARYIH